ncbi:MAG: hypothetical protein ACRDR6_01870 [Pseudonocardiaceae bacterium]
MTSSLRSLEQRIRALEARLADVEGGYGDTLYRLQREAIGTRITLSRMAAQAGLRVASEEEIDAALDEET